MKKTYTATAPFVHPRRDGYLARARRIAALALSLAQAAWFVAFVVAVQNGMPLNVPIAILGLAGIFLIASRVSQTADIALGICDRLAGLERAPDWGSITVRAGLHLVLPFLLLGVGFTFAASPPIVFGSLAGIALIEAYYRLWGHTVWNHAPIYFESLKPLLRGDPAAALEKLKAARELSPISIEETSLALSGMAIRSNKRGALEDLVEYLETREESSPADARGVFTRTLAVARADLARMRNAEDAGAVEAEALRLTPVGHPRRLALGLFVATAALEDEDPESAIKALSLLHTRDVVRSPGRVLVNWLLLEAARQTNNLSLAGACREALRTFDLQRISRMITVDTLRAENDPYARWIVRAHEALAHGGEER